MENCVEPKSIKLLDCTLRDGGYYNEWDFPQPLVEKYMRAMSESGIPIVEIGFRFLEPNFYAGPTAHTTEAYLADLDVPSDIKLGVMLNAKDLVSWSSGSEKAIDELFVSATTSRVELVRIATTWQELPALHGAVDRLNELGYEVGVNMMQIHSLSEFEIVHFGEWCEKTRVVVAYFADSFGGLLPLDIDPIVRSIRNGYSGPIGCHFHDNMSLAMANSLAALESGATWIDCTIRGMGRGPGNARTEYLAVELSRRGVSNMDVRPLISLVTNEFAELHERYGWGTNLYYLLSACNGVHPTYVQNMLTDSRFGAEDIVTAIQELGRSGGASYSMYLATEASRSSMVSAPGQWNATGWCLDRHVLIIGPGQSTAERRTDIETYIKRSKPLVINLNLSPLVDCSLIDFFVVCNPMRARLDQGNMTNDDVPIIAPNIVGSLISIWQPDRTIFDYGFVIEAKKFEVGASTCTIPYGVVAAYALAVVAQGGAKEISLVGLDGYGPADPRQSEMVEVFELFGKLIKAPSVRSLTPSSYPVISSSLYAPNRP